jgi:hypothetical protein
MTYDANSTVEIRALLGNYATYSDNSSLMLQDKLSVPSSRVKNPKRRWPDNLSQNVGKELQLQAA